MESFKSGGGRYTDEEIRVKIAAACGKAGLQYSVSGDPCRVRIGCQYGSAGIFSKKALYLEFFWDGIKSFSSVSNTASALGTFDIIRMELYDGTEILINPSASAEKFAVNISCRGK